MMKHLIKYILFGYNRLTLIKFLESRKHITDIVFFGTREINTITS